jgi:anti-sigma factor RsiW
MNPHTRVQELIASYTIDALDEDERRVAEPELLDHLSGCAACRDLYTSFREVSGELASATFATPLPQGLEDRLMEAVRGTQQIAPPAVITAPARTRVRMRALAGLAAAMIGVFGVWNLQLASQVNRLQRQSASSNVALQVLNDPRTTKTVLAQRKGPGTVTVALHPDGDAVLVGTKLPTLPAGDVLEVWLIRGGAPVPASVFTPEDGTAIVTLGIDPKRDDALAITVEHGRVEKPTTTPIFQGALTA